MNTVQDASLIGFGDLFTRAYQTQKALLPWGNSTELKIGHTEEEATLPNYITGVGNRNSNARVTGVTCSFTLYDANPRNMALIGRGTVRGVAVGEVTDEVHICEGVPGELIPFNELPDPTGPITIKDADDAALAAGEDYLVTPYGIQVTVGSKIGATGIQASYTKLKADVVEMLTTSQVELECYFAGLNAAQGGAPMPARLHRLKVGLVQEIALSGTAYAAYNVTGQLLADPRQPPVPGMKLSDFYSLGQRAA